MSTHVAALFHLQHCKLDSSRARTLAASLALRYCYILCGVRAVLVEDATLWTRLRIAQGARHCSTAAPLASEKRNRHRARKVIAPGRQPRTRLERRAGLIRDGDVDDQDDTSVDGENEA